MSLTFRPSQSLSSSLSQATAICTLGFLMSANQVAERVPLSVDELGGLDGDRACVTYLARPWPTTFL